MFEGPVLALGSEDSRIAEFGMFAPYSLLRIIFLAFFSSIFSPNQPCFASTSTPETRFGVSSNSSAYPVAELTRDDAISQCPFSSLIGAGLLISS